MEEKKSEGHVKLKVCGGKKRADNEKKDKKCWDKTERRENGEKIMNSSC